jgi:hypothetical protein
MLSATSGHGARPRRAPPWTRGACRVRDGRPRRRPRRALPQSRRVGPCRTPLGAVAAAPAVLSRGSGFRPCCAPGDREPVPGGQGVSHCAPLAAVAPARAEHHPGALAPASRAVAARAHAKHPLGAVTPARCVVASGARGVGRLGAVVPARCVVAATVRAERHLGAPRACAHSRARAEAPDLALAPARYPWLGREHARQGQASGRVYL